MRAAAPPPRLDPLALSLATPGRTARLDVDAVDAEGMATIPAEDITPAGPPVVGEVLLLDCEALDVVVHGQVWGVDEAGAAVVRCEAAR